MRLFRFFQKEDLGLSFLFVLLLLFFVDPAISMAGAEERSADAIAKKANLAAYYPGDDSLARVQFSITNARGKNRRREFVVLHRDEEDGGDQFFYVFFKNPPDVRRMAYLVWKHVDRDDDRWLYLPALDLVRRIAASDKRTRFAGSHFLYEDISGRDINEDIHVLEKVTERFYILKNTPKHPDNVAFSAFRIWVDRRTFLPMKSEYLDRKGKPYRIIEALETRNIQGYPTVTKSRVQDLKSGGKTTAVFSDIRYNLKVPKKVFSERYLRRPPKRWLK